jgi:hypothetical protein
MRLSDKKTTTRLFAEAPKRSSNPRPVDTTTVPNELLSRVVEILPGVRRLDAVELLGGYLRVIVDEFGDGDQFLAARARTSGAESAREQSAVGAALTACEARLAGFAVVHDH